MTYNKIDMREFTAEQVKVIGEVELRLAGYGVSIEDIYQYNKQIERKNKIDEESNNNHYK